MTMPYLENCPHIGKGWCLDCVKALHDKIQKPKDDPITQTVVIAFDHKIYRESGNRDIGDNGHCFKKAIVLRKYLKRCPYSGQFDHLCDLKFLYDGRVSKGHLWGAVDPLPVITERPIPPKDRIIKEGNEK